MTTNVFDRLQLLATSDSRWSYKINEREILYVDNTEFDKITVRNEFCMVFAGNSLLIQDWKAWLHQPREKLSLFNRPPYHIYIDGTDVVVSLCMIHVPTGNIWEDSDLGALRVSDEARFSGTGAEPAKTCWTTNKCARTAVKSAVTVDHYSGGQIQYVDLRTQDHNLNVVTPRTLLASSIDEAVKERGYHMDIETKISTPIADHPAAPELLQRIGGGQLYASAPVGLGVRWTPELEKKFDAALQKAIEEGRL
ncbi:MAG: hypothetical protein ACRERR_08335 [Moraxellaceae bacterium]